MAQRGQHGLGTTRTRRRTARYAAFTLIALVGSGCGNDGFGSSAGPLGRGERSTGRVLTFEKHAYPLAGAAFLLPLQADDGGHRVLVSSLARELDFTQIPYRAPFAPGGLYDVSHRAGDAPGAWSHEVVFDQSAEIRWPNQPGRFDIDNDGTSEIVVPWGFLSTKEGGIAYVEVADDGRFTDLRSFIERSACETDEQVRCGYYYHEIAPADLDGDGDLDFVTTARWGRHDPDGGSLLVWYENHGLANQVAYTPHTVDEVGGTLVHLHDVDEDGDLDLVLPQYFGGASLIWMERLGSGNDVRWSKHVIDDKSGRGFQAVFADMDGDGREDLVYANHNHQDHPEPENRVMGLYWWSIPEEPANVTDWSATKHVIYEGFEVAPPAYTAPNPNAESAPGYFSVADLHGDGRMDVVVSGDGDPGLHVLEQHSDGTFALNSIDAGVSHVNSGASWVVDIDGDAKQDIVWAVFEGVPEQSALLTFVQM